MSILQEIRAFLYEQRAVAVWGLFWALAIWVVFDLLRLGSFLRTLPRHAKNRLAELSVNRLRKRIRELERYRETLDLYRTSDKALYLHALAILAGILICLCTAGLLAIGGRFGLLNWEILAGGFLLIALLLGMDALRLTAMDTRSKIAEKAATIGGEILAMKAKLEARTR